MTVTRRTTTAVATLIALGLLTATAACAAPAAPATTPTGAGPVAPPTATPTATPEAPPPPPTCENIISSATYGSITAQGLVLTPSAEYAEKVRSEGYSLLYLFQDNGGILCPWAPGLEHTVAYAFSAITAEQASRVEADLLSKGYVASDYAGGVVYTDVTGQDYLWSHYLFIDGFWFAGTGLELIDELVANAPR